MSELRNRQGQTLAEVLCGDDHGYGSEGACPGHRVLAEQIERDFLMPLRAARDEATQLLRTPEAALNDTDRQRFSAHAEKERLADTSRDTHQCRRCGQFVPIVTHQCPVPETALDLVDEALALGRAGRLDWRFVEPLRLRADALDRDNGHLWSELSALRGEEANAIARSRRNASRASFGSADDDDYGPFEDQP